MTNKVCNQCNLEQSINNFYIDKRNGGLRSKCKKCMDSNKRKTANANQHDLKYRLKHTYNMDIEEYLVLMEQTTVCELCNNPMVSKKDFVSKSNGVFKVLDHCHTTGHVRGVICNKCNIALGLINDNVETLKKMIIYLDAHKV